MTLLFHLRLSGTLLILLGFAHLGFARPLQWDQELPRLSTVNRQIFLVHCFYVALLLVMLGALSLFLGPLLLQPHPLARAILGASVLLWGIRLYIQWFVFDPSLWRQDRWKRRVHLLFTIFWSYLVTLDVMAFFRAMRQM